MNTTLKKELPLILIVLLPFMYLLFIWSALPAQVPMHWNGQGSIDRYGSKAELIIIPFLLPFLIYILLLVIPEIDPKGKLAGMGGKLYSLRLWLTTFISLLACYILYSAKTKTFGNSNNIIIAIGILYIILGNYFKTIRPNYFLGIKTPWALENEDNWKQTHKLAGVLWFAGGLLLVILSLVVSSASMMTLFIIVTTLLVVVPVIFSWQLFRKQKAAI